MAIIHRKLIRSDIENNNGIKADIDNLSAGDITCAAAIYTVKIVLMSPFILAYLIGSICIGRLSPKSAKSKEVYMKMLHFENPKVKFLRLNITTITRAGCIALLWLVVNLCVPSLKVVTVFQCPLWKWTLFVVVILLGFVVAGIAVFFLVEMISCFNLKSSKSNLVYFMRWSMISLTFLFYFMAILVMWLCYFRTDHGLHPSKRVDKFGSWTFVSLLFGAVLLTLKNMTLSIWQANAVHKRFKRRVLIAGFQLYFLTLISIDGARLKNTMPWREEYNRKTDLKSSSQSSTNIVSDGVAKDMTNLRIQDFVLSASVSLYQICLVEMRLMDLAKVTQRENDGISDLVANCQEKISTLYEWHTVPYITEEDLMDKFTIIEKDAQLLLRELKGEQMSDHITYDTFQKWMVDAHKNCLSVGYTLIDAFEVVRVLNRLLTGFIFVVIILLWILITGVANTKMLVLIASPLLTFTFVFGDTCKTFFQGIVFSFVTHPYDVGDRCIIEGMELEVKRIGILTTTFLKVGTKEKMIYPNATLATKLIINLEGEPDPSDTIQLSLDLSTTTVKILGLKKDLESFFENTDREGYYEKNVHVAVKEIKNGIKISISFTHVMNVQDVSHSQCLQKKNKQRSELFIEIKQFLDTQEIKLAAL